MTRAQQQVMTAAANMAQKLQLPPSAFVELCGIMAGIVSVAGGVVQPEAEFHLSNGFVEGRNGANANMQHQIATHTFGRPQ